MVVVNFPDHHRDLAGMKADGFDFSTPSDMAVKMYDSLLHQMIYHFEDPLLGGSEGTAKKMFQADPDFAMGHIMTLGLQCLGTTPSLESAVHKKLSQFNDEQKKAKLTSHELLHLTAANQMAVEDIKGAMDTFETILEKHPLDPYALHMAYFLALTTGHTSRMRDTPKSVVKHYKPSTPFYGNVHGKLSFGQSEMGEFQAGELSGRLALDHCRLDNWSHHALAHNFDESNRPLQGSLFLANTADDWKRGSNFEHHLRWHAALLQVALGNFEEALTMYDEFVGPLTIKAGGPFPLSDASSLLMRLHMEGVPTGSRAQEVARAYKDNLEYRGLFYDGHACFATLLADDRDTHRKLLESVHDYLESQRSGWNKEVTQRVGVPLLEGITQYFDQDYSKSVATLAPIMGELQTKIQGSRAQKDVFRQILLSAAIKSGAKADLAQAKQVLAKELEESGLEAHKAVNQRIIDRVLAIH